MKPRRIYYRKKGKSIVIEGKRKGKSIFIWTLPKDPHLLLKFIYGTSYLSLQKIEKIEEKIRRLDYKTKRKKKGA